MSLLKALSISPEVLYYTGSGKALGRNNSDGFVVASTDYVDTTLRDILTPLEPLEPLQASKGFYYIFGNKTVDGVTQRVDIVLPDKPYIDKLAYVTLANAKLNTSDKLTAFENRYTPYMQDYVAKQVYCNSSRASDFLIQDTNARLNINLSSLESKILSNISAQNKSIRDWVQNDFQIPTINRINNWQQDVLDFVTPYFPAGGASGITGITGAVVGDVVGSKIHSKLANIQPIDNTHLHFTWDDTDYGVVSFRAKDEIFLDVSNDNGSFVGVDYRFSENKVEHYYKLISFLVQDLVNKTWDFKDHKFLNAHVDTPTLDTHIANKKYVDDIAGLPYTIDRTNVLQDQKFNLYKHVDGTTNAYSFTYDLKNDGLDLFADRVLCQSEDRFILRYMGKVQGDWLTAGENWGWNGNVFVPRRSQYSVSDGLTTFYNGKNIFEEFLPRCSKVPTLDDDLVNKKYIDDLGGLAYEVNRQNERQEQMFWFLKYPGGTNNIATWSYFINQKDIEYLVERTAWENDAGYEIGKVNRRIDANDSLQYFKQWKHKNNLYVSDVTYYEEGVGFNKYYYGNVGFLDTLPKCGKIPVEANDLTNKNFVDYFSLQVGLISEWLTGYFPNNFLQCAGQYVLKTQYPKLYAVLKGYTPEQPDWFQVPNKTHQGIYIIFHGQYTNTNASMRKVVDFEKDKITKEYVCSKTGKITYQTE